MGIPFPVIHELLGYAYHIIPFQVQNLTSGYQSSLPSTSQQTGQNVQTMHVTQPTTYNGQ